MSAAPDKLLHLAAGTALYVAGAAVHPVVGALFVLAGAWGREEWSRRTGRGTRDGWDAFATMVGIPVGQLFLGLLQA